MPSLANKSSVAFVGFNPAVPNVTKGAFVKAIIPAKLAEVYSMNNFTSRRNYTKWALFCLFNSLSNVCGPILTFMRMVFGSPFKSFSSSLGGTIGHVIFLSAYKQMVWPDTGRIVAMVANKHLPFKLAISKLIRYSMGFCHKLVQPAAKLHNAISKPIFSASPIPALVSLIDFFPKSVANSSHKGNIRPILGMSTLTYTSGV